MIPSIFAFWNVKRKSLLIFWKAWTSYGECLWTTSKVIHEWLATFLKLVVVNWLKLAKLVSIHQIDHIWQAQHFLRNIIKTIVFPTVTIQLFSGFFALGAYDLRHENGLRPHEVIKNHKVMFHLGVHPFSLWLEIIQLWFSALRRQTSNIKVIFNLIPCIIL